MKHINSYPLTYKTIVCNYYFENKGKHTVKDILNLFKISNGTLYNWINAYKNNNLTEKATYTKSSKYTIEIRQYIQTYVLKVISFDYKKLIRNIETKFMISVSKTMIYEILDTLKITRKKFNKRIIPNKKNYNNKIKKFKNQISKISKDNIICIDETGIDTHQSANYGWSMKGTRIVKSYKRSRVKYTIISAISNKKVICNKIIKGSANAIQFKDFLTEVIKNTDRPMFLLMDNARFHHSKIVLDYIQTTNHQIIYNVPYAPEYNPIELIFAKFKSLMRKKNNSTQHSIINNITSTFKKITVADLVNCYNHSLNF